MRVSLALSLAVIATGAFAQSWPTKNVRVVVPFSAGSAVDIVSRTVFEQVGAQTGQTIVIENRTGGAGAIGVSAIAKAEPDGYSALAYSNALVTAPATQSMPYDPVADFAGVATLGNVPLVLIISPDKGIKTLKQLVDNAKAKPGSLNYATAGIGSPTHLAMERLRLASGLTGQVVPFRGAPEAITEVMTGRVDVYICPLTPALPFIKDGKLLALLVTGSKRTAFLPDVPTALEAGFPNADFDFWIASFLPKQTPRDVVRQMHAEIGKALNDPALKQKFANLGIDQLISTPEELDARVAREVPIAVELAKAAGLGPK